MKNDLPAGSSTSLWRVDFDVDILALSSIVHRDSARRYGTDVFTLFHREMVITASGEQQAIPLISGNSFRGTLRRIGEDLTARILNYENKLPVPAAQLMRSGGRLGKAARPMTDEQERELRYLIPYLALFGGAASARIMSGLLQVDKVLPLVAELEHLLEHTPAAAHFPLRPAGLLMAAEDFTHLSDTRPAASEAPQVVTGDDGIQTRLGIEVMPAGTRLHSQVRLANATDLQLDFLLAVLNEFATDGHLGGRGAAGHGRIRATITPTVRRGPTTDLTTWERPGWAEHLATHRQAAIDALTALT